jgi:hypothetical protein
MTMRYSSGNKSTIERGWTYPVLVLGLEYAAKLRRSGLVQNFYTWELKHRIDCYYLGRNKLYAGPQGLPHSQIDLWSVRALAEKDPRKRVREHGAPRTPFALMILELYLNGNLTEELVNEMMDFHYRVAVITKEEDARLNAIGARSKMYPTPDDRWAAAGIKIVSRKERDLR